MTTTQEKPKTRYVYSLDQLEKVPEGPNSCTVAASRLLSGDSLETGKSTTRGPVLSGSHVHIAWVVKPRGTGSKLHTHPNEQFNFVLKGTLIADMDGQVMRVPAGHVIHIPAGMPHSHVSSPEEDVHFVAAKDTRHGITGPAVDGKHNGPRALAGFGGGDNEWPVGPDGELIPQSTRVSADKVRYVYKWDELDKAPEGPCSAKVIPTGSVSGKSSSYGAALVGDKIQVGLIRKGRGSGSKLHTHPNEQFNLVLEGALVADIDGQEGVMVPRNHAIHMPAGVVHSCVASAAGDVLFFVAKDTRHGLAGPPIDGIEDGPRYLPGFGPKK